MFNCLYISKYPLKQRNESLLRVVHKIFVMKLFINKLLNVIIVCDEWKFKLNITMFVWNIEHKLYNVNEIVNTCWKCTGENVHLDIRKCL